MKIDKNGYPIGRIEHSNLVHRQIAYKEIYLKNKDKYPLPFSKYQVHHKNGNKKDFRVENLEILTEAQHRDKHGLPPKNESLFAEEENKLSLKELVEKKRIKMEEDENNFSFTGKHRPNYKINQDSVDKIWNNKWVAPKKERTTKNKKKKLEGISGWLDLWFLYFIVVGVGIFLWTIAIPFTINISSLSTWAILTRAAQFLFLIWMMYTFFTKKKVFIILVNIFLIISLVRNLMGLNYLLVILNILWVGYFYKSKRVKNTFVN